VQLLPQLRQQCDGGLILLPTRWFSFLQLHVATL
jgi:hypothetical protein